MKDKNDHTSRKDDNILTIPEVANRLKMSKSKIYSMVSAEKIPYIRIGFSVRIMESDLMTWLASQKVSPQ